MTIAIKKYTLSRWEGPVSGAHQDVQIVELPIDAEIFAAAYQAGELRLWTLVDPDEPTVKRVIHIYEDGEAVEPVLRKVASIEGNPVNANLTPTHIATVLGPRILNGNRMGNEIVWHLFDAGVVS